MRVKKDMYKNASSNQIFKDLDNQDYLSLTNAFLFHSLYRVDVLEEVCFFLN